MAGGHEDYKYPGFISYSHQDRRWGQWLHRALERYRVPTRLIGEPGMHGKIPARLYPIFRDRDELPASGALGETLRAALADSCCFVLICSPASARSRWVNEEVQYFLNLGGAPRLLCLIVAGEPNATAAGQPERECFPPALRGRPATADDPGLPAIEPIAADVRDHADGRTNARLKIIAGLLGVGFDDLKRRDLVARNRRLGILAAVSLGIAAVTVALAITAMLAQRAAENSRLQGEQLIAFMLGELRGKLEPLGKLDILDSVGDKAMAYFDGLQSRNQSTAALAARAKALRQIGEVRVAQGQTTEAIGALSSALTLQETITAQSPDDLDQLFELGQTEFWIGYAAWQSARFDEAEVHFRAYQRVAETLISREPGNSKWQLEAVYALTNLGALAFERRRYDEALPFFAQSAERAKALIGAEVQDPEAISTAVGALSWQGSTLQRLNRSQEALAKLGEHTDLLRKLCAQAPDDRRQQLKLTSSLTALGNAATEVGESELALRSAEDGLALADALLRNEPANQEVRITRGALLEVASVAHFQGRRWLAAEQAITAARRSLLEVLRLDSSNENARSFLYTAELQSYEVAWQRGDATAARAIAAEAARELGTALPSSPSNRQRITFAQAHVMALEFQSLIDRNLDAKGRILAAITEALDGVRDPSATDFHRAARVRAVMALIDGAEAVPVDALPKTSLPRDASVLSFVARHCAARPPRLSPAVCRSSALPTTPES